MNWINELCDLYEKNKCLAGKMTYKVYHTKSGEEKTPMVLLPVFHTTVAAQITVSVDEEGNFLRAEAVGEEDKTTIIPVTEKSGSRTAGVEPHPLCDNLKYLAGDYMSYYRKTAKAKDFTQNHLLYMEGLKKWVDSPYSNTKVRAVYQYIHKASLIGDLVKSDILKLDEDGFLNEKNKLQNISQPDAFVRFQVEGLVDKDDVLFGDGNQIYHTECWLDVELHKSYIDYYKSTFSAKDICYLTGEETQISYLQPKKIRNEGDGSKLISSNDETNFTYRGRFRDKTEAFAVGFETSQKAHNALKWIIRKQGNYWDGLCTVIWESDLKPVPEWNADTDSIMEQFEDASNGWDIEESGDNEQKEMDSSADENKFREYRGTGDEKAVRFHEALKGYERYLGNTSRVVLMAFDAATTGRLAMTECMKLDTARYLHNLKSWHDGCRWVHYKYKNGERYEFKGMVSVKEIAEILYGTEQKGMLSLNGKTKMYAQLCKRILPCIMNKNPIPYDLVNLAVNKASSPVSYEKRYNWEKVLTLACSLVKKQMADEAVREHGRVECEGQEEQDKGLKENRFQLLNLSPLKRAWDIKMENREEWTVALNTQCDDRNYLYGRLLAAADRIEYRTFDKEKDGGRVTNAKRYMCAFSQRPFQTWKVIEEKIQPYLAKLKPQERFYYLGILEKICEKFTVESFSNNESLNGLYLLGFHSQAYDFSVKPELNKEEE